MDERERARRQHVLLADAVVTLGGGRRLQGGDRHLPRERKISVTTILVSGKEKGSFRRRPRTIANANSKSSDSAALRPAELYATRRSEAGMVWRQSRRKRLAHAFRCLPAFLKNLQ